MAEEGLKHPGSWVGDATEEFKKLPTWGKFAAVGVLVAVIGIAIYEKNKAGSTVGSSLTGTTGTTGNSLSGGTQSPFASVPNASGTGSAPLIPFGDTPLFDTLGNLIGWQQPAPTSTPTVTPTMPPTRVPPVTPTPGPNTIINNPLVPNSLKVWFGQGGVLYQGTDVNHQTQVNIPKGYTLRAGSDGRYWDIGGGKQQLITNNFVQSAPPPAIHKVNQTSPPVQKRV